MADTSQSQGTFPLHPLSALTNTLPDGSTSIQPPKSSTSKLSSLNPFKKSAGKEKEKEIPPKLAEAIKQMEERKEQKRAELEAQGKTPNNEDKNSKAQAAPTKVEGAVGAVMGGLGSLGG